MRRAFLILSIALAAVIFCACGAVDAGLQLYSFDEIDEMIDIQEAYVGLTQEILNSPPANWMTLSGEAR